jgi:hypothetical protein
MRGERVMQEAAGDAEAEPGDGQRRARLRPPKLTAGLLFVVALDTDNVLRGGGGGGCHLRSGLAEWMTTTYKKSMLVSHFCFVLLFTESNQCMEKSDFFLFFKTYTFVVLRMLWSGMLTYATARSVDSN